jgi:spermidine/putrescine ABC transporter ATP-binding subunit
MSSVNICQVSKRYGEVVALDHVSLTFGEREFFGLLGPSGSGKTTLLRSIAGFIEPTSGQILIEGSDISRVPTYKRNVGMVFQNYALFPHMNVYENVAFPLSVRRVGETEIRRRVSEILELVQLAGYDKRRPRELSGGQQQRIALARALVSRPRVLLLDEPLGALDKNLRQHMQIELRQIQREVGITTVLVTHDQEEALTLSDRIAVFRKGEVVQMGSPDEVYERPRNAFAAEFFGATNFLKGRAAGTHGKAGVVALDGGEKVLTLDPLPADGQAVTITVRPEKFAISAASGAAVGADEAINSLPGEVVQPVYMGASVTYRVSVAGTELTVFQQNREAQRFRTSDKVVISWRACHSIALDRS